MASRANDQRPIVIKRVKKVAGGHHGGAWKVAYADFVTAMMAFFMLLWLISNPDKERLKGLAQYFSPDAATSAGASGSQIGDQAGLGHTRRAQADQNKAKGQPTMETGPAGASRGGTAAIPDASMRVLAAELRLAIDSTPEDQGKQNMQVDLAPDGLRITLMDNDRQSMFRAGTAQLNAFGRGLLARVAAKLGPSGVQIAIEGHTDGDQSDANWRLSSDRALAARTTLIGDGVTPDRFSQIIGMGATKPVYPDQPNRPENRRITIVVQAQASPLPSDASFKF